VPLLCAIASHYFYAEFYDRTTNHNMKSRCINQPIHHTIMNCSRTIQSFSTELTAVPVSTKIYDGGAHNSKSNKFMFHPCKDNFDAHSYNSSQEYASLLSRDDQAIRQSDTQHVDETIRRRRRATTSCETRIHNRAPSYRRTTRVSYEVHPSLIFAV
jgi:hypothetical protein